ncbi:MAG: protein kinase [Anaerolineales bacterium]|nr:protein kinase [Anaerolineales bacterium]
MKQVCLLCGRMSSDGNLWCQEFDCPAEEKPTIFNYGQFLGDVKIDRMLRVTRTAAFYKADRADMPVLLKVAHPGADNQLKREAEILRQHQSSLFTQHHPVLPTLLPAYGQSTTAKHPFGRAIVADEERFYEVFQHIEGDFLRDMLIENPQPWYEHAAWLTMSIADAIASLHIKAKRLHLALSPDMILVRTDDEGIPRPVLLDLGMMIQQTEPEHLQWLHYHWYPAYTAPELTYISPEDMDACQPATPASDVYGIGTLLYEMLAGYPVHEYHRKRQDQVRESVLHHRPSGLARTDLPEAIHKIVERTISKPSEERYQDVPAFIEDLQAYFGVVPAEKKRRTAFQRIAVGLVILVAIVSFVVLLIALLG